MSATRLPAQAVKVNSSGWYSIRSCKPVISKGITSSARVCKAVLLPPPWMATLGWLRTVSCISCTEIWWFIMGITHDVSRWKHFSPVGDLQWVHLTADGLHGVQVRLTEHHRQILALLETH